MHSRQSHRLSACGCRRSLAGSAQHQATPSADVRPSGMRDMRLPSCQSSQAGTRPNSQHPARSQPYSRREAAPRHPHARPQGTGWPLSDPHSGGTACQRCAVHRQSPSPDQPGRPAPAEDTQHGSQMGRHPVQNHAPRTLVIAIQVVRPGEPHHETQPGNVAVLRRQDQYEPGSPRPAPSRACAKKQKPDSSISPVTPGPARYG